MTEDVAGIVEQVDPTLKDLSNQERLFVASYVVTLDVWTAAKAAGFADSMALSKCYGWVRNGKTKPHVFAAVQKGLLKRENRFQATADRVLHEIELLAFSNAADFFEVDENGYAWVDLTELTREQTAAIAEITAETFTVPAKDPAAPTPETDEKGDQPKNVPVRRTKVKFHSKEAALQTLAKHFGLLKDKIDLTLKNGKKPFVVQLTTTDDKA